MINKTVTKRFFQRSFCFNVHDKNMTGLLKIGIMPQKERRISQLTFGRSAHNGVVLPVGRSHPFVSA